MNNQAPSEEQRLSEVKQAYIDGLIDAGRLEEDVLFVLNGGYFAGGYAAQIRQLNQPATR